MQCRRGVQESGSVARNTMEYCSEEGDGCTLHWSAEVQSYILVAMLQRCILQFSPKSQSLLLLLLLLLPPDELEFEQVSAIQRCSFFESQLLSCQLWRTV